MSEARKTIQDTIKLAAKYKADLILKGRQLQRLSVRHGKLVQKCKILKAEANGHDEYVKKTKRYIGELRGEFAEISKKLRNAESVAKAVNTESGVIHRSMDDILKGDSWTYGDIKVRRSQTHCVTVTMDNRCGHAELTKEMAKELGEVLLGMAHGYKLELQNA